MQLPIALNTILGSALIIILIFANYIGKFNTDRFQRNTFCAILIFIFIAMACDLSYLLFAGSAGKAAWIVLHASCTGYYFFQVLSYFCIIVFIDYMIYRNTERGKKIIIAVIIVTVIHIIILALNVKWHFYYQLNEDTNVFSHGSGYYIRLLFSYCPIIAAIWALVSSHKIFKTSHRIMMFMLLAFPFIGSIVDLLFDSMRLLWPCITASLLYSYFFIVQSDSRIDSLTGIGNRFSFNEFTDKLSRRGAGESWAVVMIDMDHFKQINDTLGHQEGDNALRDMAAILKKCLRMSDFAARYGGDEFVLATRVENGIVSLMREIQTAVDQHNEKEIRPFKLEISYGYDVYTANGKQSIEEFLSHIDGLMYKHKQERRRSSDQRSADK